MRDDIEEGATFPDYELPYHTGVRRKLSFLQGGDLMILMLGRGVWCPKDWQQLHELVRFSAQCAVGFTRILTITTDNPMLSNDLKLGVGADWPFLHDEKRVIQKDLEIQEYTDPYNDPMIPHTFVLEPGLKIYKIYNSYWYWGRPSTAELHQNLREITKKNRQTTRLTPRRCELSGSSATGARRSSIRTASRGSRSSRGWPGRSTGSNDSHGTREAPRRNGERG